MGMGFAAIRADPCGSRQAIGERRSPAGRASRREDGGRMRFAAAIFVIGAISFPGEGFRTQPSTWTSPARGCPRGSEASLGQCAS